MYISYIMATSFSGEGSRREPLTTGSLLTSNIEYGDIMIEFFSILQHFPGKF
jgi:hypothetical protein